MAKDLRSFLDDCRREIPNEVIHITKEVNPANYDVTAIIKHLGAQKRFPVIIFDKPLNLNGRVSDIKLTMNCEISQRKTQIALGLPKEASRPEMAEDCLEMEEHRIPPIIVEQKARRLRKTSKSAKTLICTRFRSCAITRWTAGPTYVCRRSAKIQERYL